MYEVDEDGSVYSLKYGEPRRLRPSKANRGIRYHRVSLSKKGVSAAKLVHRLVAFAFLGAPTQGQEVRHLDGNPDNNAASNLAWGTRSENMMDAVRHGTHSSNREKTHCKQGHEFTPENTMARAGIPNGRMCRTCKREWKNAWAARKRDERSG